MEPQIHTNVVVPKLSVWFAAVLAFFCPIAKILMILCGLVILDGISGVWASLKRGELPQSYGLRLIPAKFGGFCIMIITAFLVDRLLGDGLWVTNVATGAIAIHEFQSVVENVEYITGYRLWNTFVNKLRGKKLQPMYKKDDKE